MTYLLTFVFTPFIPNNEENFGIFDIIRIAILYFISILLAWILMDTQCSSKIDKFFYNSGTIRGSMEIENICKNRTLQQIVFREFSKTCFGK